MKHDAQQPRETWSSGLAFIWVATGAAVGLGNVWKFPYMAGSSGGSAFVLLYLVFVALIAMPVMAAEIMLGKLSERNALDGFIYLAKRHHRSPLWRVTAYLGLSTLQLVFCFYSVVAGWSVAYLFFGATNSFHSKSSAEIENLWVNFLADPTLLIFCTFIFIAFTMVIVWLGIKKGIEKACSLMMPALFIVLVILVFYAISSGGFFQAFQFLFAFDAEQLTPSVIIASLGHAFFTLAVGACAMMVYGSYMPKRASVAGSVFAVAILDVLVALLSGLAIFPLTFEHGLSPSQGPGLMFISLPMVFSTMPFAWFWGSLFFLLLFFAALSSSLSFAEPLVNVLNEKFSLSRRTSVLIIGGTTMVGATFCALSFNIFADVMMFDRFTIFDIFADVSTNFLLPIGGIAISVFAGLIIKQSDFFPHAHDQARLVFHSWRIVTLIIAPLAILTVLVNSIWDFIAPFIGA